MANNKPAYKYTPKPRTSNNDLVRSVLFPKTANTAKIITKSKDMPVEEVFKLLELGSMPNALIMSFGGAGGIKALSSTVKSQLDKFFRDGIAQYACNSNCLIIDGGTKSGVMEMMGNAVSDCGRKCNILGVAPVNNVAFPGQNIPRRSQLDPNHSHFVLSSTRGFGTETPTMFEVAEFMVKSNTIPVICIVTNGGVHTLCEVTNALERNWNCLIIQNSGFLADELCYLKSLEDTTSLDNTKISHIVEGNATQQIIQKLELIHIVDMKSAKTMHETLDHFLKETTQNKDNNNSASNNNNK